jgi:hypothetical protein
MKRVNSRRLGRFWSFGGKGRKGAIGGFSRPHHADDRPNWAKHAFYTPPPQRYNRVSCPLPQSSLDAEQRYYLFAAPPRNGAPFVPQKTLHVRRHAPTALPSRLFARLLRDAYGGRVAFVVDLHRPLIATTTPPPPGPRNDLMHTAGTKEVHVLLLSSA